MKSDVLTQLAELLQHPEQAALPNIETLDTQQRDFTLDRVAGVLYPAARQLGDAHQSFFIDQKALYTYLAQRQQIDLDSAQRQLADFIDTHRTLLTQEGIPLGPVGNLKLQDDQLAFVIDPDHNLDLEHFGLPPLTHVEPVLSSQEKFSQHPIAPKRMPRPRTYAELIRESMDLKFVIVVIGLLLLNLPIMYYIKFKMGSPTATSPSTAPLQPEAPEQYIDYDAPEPIKPTPEQPRPNPTPIPDEAADQDSPKGNVPAVNAAKHLIVLGVFSSKQNAESLQVTLFDKGYNPTVTQLPSGAYRVGVLIMGAAEDVPSQLEKLKKTYKGAYWKQ